MSPHSPSPKDDRPVRSDGINGTDGSYLHDDLESGGMDTLTATASPQSSVDDLLLHANIGPATRLTNATSAILFDESAVKFEFPVPQSFPPESYDQQLISETASRLLFLSVHWIKNVKALTTK